MNYKLKVLIFITLTLSLTEFSIAEVSSENTQEKVTPKPLKVEEGATKIGEEKDKQEKTRGLRVSHPSDNSIDTNMNIGKIEFVVK